MDRQKDRKNQRKKERKLEEESGLKEEKRGSVVSTYVPTDSVFDSQSTGRSKARFLTNKGNKRWTDKHIKRWMDW